MTLRFLHTADWHLGAGFGALPEDVAAVRSRQQRECIEWLMDKAVSSDSPVDVVLIVGDVFDSPTPPPSEIGFFESQLQRLADANTQVFTIPGTGGHDAYRPGGVWDRMSLYGAHLFHNEEFISKKVIGFEDVTVWGVACDPARPDQNLLSTAAQLPMPGPSIGLYHGALSGRYEQEGEKGNAFTQDDVQRAPFTYLALGHYHRLASVLDTPAKKAFYPGAPAAISFRASELGKRYALQGELSENGEISISELVIPAEFGIHNEEVLDCTRLLLEQINEHLREWADRNVFMKVHLKGIASPDIMSEAGQLEERHRDNYGYLRLSLDFDDLRGAEENEYLRMFLQHALEEIEQETDEEREALLREALRLGTEALLRGGGR